MTAVVTPRGAPWAGSAGSLPRFTRQPTAGTGEYRTTFSAALLAALRRVADDIGLPLSSVWLAAYAKVAGAVCGRREIAIGYVMAPGQPPLMCAISTEPPSWRALLRDAHRGASELRPSGERFDIVFDASAGGPGALLDGVALSIGFAEQHGIELRLRYRTDVFDADSAARIAGYHRTALTSIAVDPDADHARQTLLSPEELRFQLLELAGPSRARPDRRVHELFEDRARTHPDAVAAVHGQTQWTYGELNRRANQLAHALGSHGLRREGAVAVVTRRNLHWMAAAFAVFKAGGAYLPIEAEFPAQRIAHMIAQADCRLVLAERGCSASLERALDSVAGVEVLDIEAVYEAGPPAGNPGVAVTPDQLAYIYFTSGSTGAPKGVMCEHRGMLNHILAKIQDLGLAEGDVVAQTAPQCFDISLWQLVSATLAGGRTLIVDQDAILDPARLVDAIAGARAAVVQVVPSYLEVLVGYLAQHPRQFPHLRCVSVTGEALKKPLVEQWFAIQPSIKLLNAYGLTETSDDTNHEIMDRVPDRDRVPLGVPIDNVHVYVVDEQLSLVPLGAPGEIVFSGICVGRGYVNDPDRTRLAFLPDPYRKHQRLYCSGDYGRWLPDGKLEFLGRRDTQVKVRGFRVELDEIERTLMGVPGIRDAAAVVTGGAGAAERVVAFYSGETEIDARTLRDWLLRSLPEYMLPSGFRWRGSLPLTANGKVDRKTLTIAAAGIAHGVDDLHAPTTATERRLADLWAALLGIPAEDIGPRQRFFDLGGTSLSALKLLVALDRKVSLEELTDHSSLAALAALIDAR